MYIIQRLPFPDEVCRKIFLFACKTPHTGLGVEVLKNKLNMKCSCFDDDLTKEKTNVR